MAARSEVSALELDVAGMLDAMEDDAEMATDLLAALAGALPLGGAS